MSQMMKKSQIKMCLNKLIYDIPNERVKYGLKVSDHILARYQFQSYLLLYYDNHNHVHSDKVLKLFNNLKNDNKIDLSIKESDQTVMIDLTECQYEQEISFFLRYLFNDFADIMVEKDLLIMIGKNIDDDIDSIKTKYHKQKIKNIRKRKEYLSNILKLMDSEMKGLQINDNIIKIDKQCVEKLKRYLQDSRDK